MEAMPLGRLASRLIAEEKREKEGERRRAQDWIAQGYVIARVVVSALRADKPMPQTKAEQKKTTPDSKIKKMQKQKKAEDEPFFNSLQGFQHFGSWVGMEDIWGAPEEPLTKSSEEIKAEQEQAFSNFRQRFSEAVRQSKDRSHRTD